MSKKRLGKGLDALLSKRDALPEAVPAAIPDQPASQSPAENIPSGSSAVLAPSAAVGEQIYSLAVEAIQPSQYQPRQVFDEAALDELAASIRQSGLLQPIVVRQRADGGYELIAGERRWRATQRAGLTQIAALVRPFSDREASALALIENIQREDLSALEESAGLARLRDEFGLTQQELADAVGKSRASVANSLRLMSLGFVAQELLRTGALEMGHGRALLGLSGGLQDQIAQFVAERHLSVRDTEALVRKRLAAAAGGKPAVVEPDADIRILERQLMDRLGALVKIKHKSSGAGEVSVKYGSVEELEGILQHFDISE
ncbi:MAG TPA: chromosome partitioning protein ParB [Gammaproteobacteria bacterium]|nr:chromosome partitioning protein ParB [Gammaproteobacteria bacterium]|tara:strand:- start:8969 stop:9922 length:954 start_codon:yes stop_codon:yes gene_type:complete